MKKIFKFYFLVTLVAAFCFTSCKKFLDVEPLDRVPASDVLSNPDGIKALLATLYNQMPIEDFSYNPGSRFNYYPQGAGFNLGWSTSFFTDESVYTAGSGAGPVNDGYWGYNTIRRINQFFETINEVHIGEGERNRLWSESRFIRAYVYFALAKRYGGVPIIKEAQNITDSTLFVPRSTEKATWDFILSECDSAVKYLPPSPSAEGGAMRATKWAAYALKSRAALFAASVAKYWSKAPVSGEAVDLKLLGGMNNSDADNYYKQCIEASLAIINNSGKQLYQPAPVSVEAAAKNYQHIFESPMDPEVQREVIFSKNYVNGSETGQQGHNTDVFFNPAQTNLGSIYYGRFSPTLNLVDLYEDYADNGTGVSAPLITRTDGNEDYVVADPTNLDVTIPFKGYNNLSDIFVGRDARLFASVIVPGSEWKGVSIVMQAGLITPDGKPRVYRSDVAVGLDGNTYYTFGAASSAGYSGFSELGGPAANTNYSSTGFSLKKFLQEDKRVDGKFFSSDNPYIDFRLPEIYLNYAEAAVESGQGDMALAARLLNDIRHRAAHKDHIPATLQNVLKERRIELVFEGGRYWDLVRRREYSELFDNTKRLSLLPILDLRKAVPKYIFVRAYNFYDNRVNGVTFQRNSYYRPIPGTSNNNLIQNPGY